MSLFDDREIPPDVLKQRIGEELIKRKAKEDPVALAHAAGIETHPWQERFLRSKSHRILMNCSRQAGKTTLCGIKGLHRALFTPKSTVLLIAPTERQAKILFWKASEPYKQLGRMVAPESETALQLYLSNGSKIIALPGQANNIRGYSAHLVVIDEAAYVDEDLYFALRPMLAVSRGDLVLASTPHGKQGIFFDEWVDGGPSWERFEVPAPLSPHIPPETLEEERKKGEGYFQQEFMAQFLDVADALFPWEVVQEAITDEFDPIYL